MAVAAKDALRAGAIVVVTHVDVPPPFKDTVVPMLQQLAEASRKDAGNQRFEVQQQANRPNHFTVRTVFCALMVMSRSRGILPAGPPTELAPFIDTSMRRTPSGRVPSMNVASDRHLSGTVYRAASVP
jgi:hypothetical protein